MSQLEPLPRKADRRTDDGTTIELAVALERIEHARNRTGHPHCKVRVRRQTVDDHAILVLVHVARCRERSCLAMVVGDDRAILEANHHEASTAEIARRGPGHGECEAGRHGSVDGITAGAEDVETDFGCDHRSRCHCSALATHGLWRSSFR